jgi:hypothetical protein
MHPSQTLDISMKVLSSFIQPVKVLSSPLLLTEILSLFIYPAEVLSLLMHSCTRQGSFLVPLLSFHIRHKKAFTHDRLPSHPLGLRPVLWTLRNSIVHVPSCRTIRPGSFYKVVQISSTSTIRTLSAHLVPAVMPA